MDILPRSTLNDGDFDGLSSWGLRLGMASLGWRSEVSTRSSIQNPRNLIVSVRLTHDCWHGTLAPVKLWRNCEVDSENDEGIVEAVTTGLQKLGHLGRRAWREWPHAVPFMAEDGDTLLEHTSETEYFRNYPTPRVVFPERSRPTEALPGWPGQITLEQFLDYGRTNGDGWLEQVVEFVRGDATADWNDMLSAWEQLDNFNYINRPWKFELKPRIGRWGDLRIARMSAQFRCLQITTADLSTTGAMLACQAVVSGKAAMIAAYPPDGGRLPPGMQEYVAPVPVEDDRMSYP